MTIRYSHFVTTLLVLLALISQAYAALGTRFVPPVDRSIEPTSRIRFYAVSISWPCPWLSALVVPSGDKLKVGVQYYPSLLKTYFSYSEDYGFMSNNSEYLFVDGDTHSVTLGSTPHPEVVWRNGTVALRLGGTDTNVTYGASLAACPVAGTSSEYSIEYNSSCTGGHRIQLRAVGPGTLTTMWQQRTGQDETPSGSAQEKGSKKGSTSFEKRAVDKEVEGSKEFEEKLRLRLMGLIE